MNSADTFTVVAVDGRYTLKTGNVLSPPSTMTPRKV